MAQRSLVFPVLRELFQFCDEDQNVYLELREPIELDDAHQRLFAGIREGGKSLGVLLKELPRAIPGDPPRPGLNKLKERLARPDSFIEPAPYTGRKRYDAVIVDFGCGGRLASRVRELVADPPPHTRTLALLGRRPNKVSRKVDLIVLDKSYAAPLGSPFRFTQFVRSILKYLTPTRVFVSDILDTLPLFEALPRHTYGIGVRRSLTPYLMHGSFLAEFEERGDEEVFGDMLYWVRRTEKMSQMVDAVEMTSSATVAGWRAICGARTLFFEKAEYGRALLFRMNSIPKEKENYRTYEIKSFLYPCASMPTRRKARGGRPSPAAQLGDPSVLGKTSSRRISRSTSKPGQKKVLFACFHLLGDLLNTTQSVRAYRKLNPGCEITFLTQKQPHTRVLELSPDIDRLVYSQDYDPEEIVCESSYDHVRMLPYYQRKWDFRHIFDIQLVARMSEVRDRLHASEGYAARLGISLNSRRPILDPRRARRHLPPGLPKGPFVVITRHSVSNPHQYSRYAFSRTWLESRWRELARQMVRELDIPIVSIGTASEDRLDVKGVINRHDLSILQVAGLLAKAELQVTVDNGVSHLGEALGKKMVQLYPKALPRTWATPAPEVSHEVVQEELRKLQPDRVLSAVRRMLEPQ